MSNSVAYAQEVAADDMGFIRGFVGYGPTDPASEKFEDEVLAILPEHGAKVLFRGRRAPREADDLPLEMHVVWFPSVASFDAYVGDPARASLLAHYGDVFTTKQGVELIPLTNGLT